MNKSHLHFLNYTPVSEHMKGNVGSPRKVNLLCSPWKNEDKNQFKEGESTGSPLATPEADL